MINRHNNKSINIIYLINKTNSRVSSIFKIKPSSNRLLKQLKIPNKIQQRISSKIIKHKKIY